MEKNKNHKNLMIFGARQVGKTYSIRAFGNNVDRIKNSFYVTQIFNVKRIEYPLENYADETNFRLYPTDIGLLVASYDFSLKKHY